jgi:hypothetical protein
MVTWNGITRSWGRWEKGFSEALGFRSCFVQLLDFLARSVVRPWFGVEHSKCAEDLIVYRCLAGDRFLDEKPWRLMVPEGDKFEF